MSWRANLRKGKQLTAPLSARAVISLSLFYLYPSGDCLIFVAFSNA
jgi:hypothetical protein